MEEGARWKCVHCDKVMDRTNFRDFIRESDNDKNSNQEARVQYHPWHLLGLVGASQEGNENLKRLVTHPVFQ